MDKTEYCRPDLTIMSFRLQDVLSGSPEDFNSHLDDGNDDWGDLPFDPDPDEEIIW